MTDSDKPFPFPTASDHPAQAKPQPQIKQPAHEEKRIDKAVEDSFPASDASAETQPKPTREQRS
jgi:hypothetical protein